MQALSRRKIATYIADELARGAAVKPMLKRAAAYLVERKQVSQVELLVRDIEAILAKDHGVVLARVISARELSGELITNIEQFVARAESAKQVEVKTSVDPSLLGGVIIKTPSSEMNTTIRKQLNELRT